LSRLKLVNFRSFKEREFLLAAQTIIFGPNGSGKTNILEAFYLLATTTSFRAKDEKDLITIGEDFTRVEFGELAVTLKRESEKVKKNYTIADKKIPLYKALGRLKVVLFSPEILNVIAGSPNERRRFLNIAVSQTDNLYAFRLSEYKNILRQRNALLSLIKNRQADIKELEFWDQELTSVGMEIISKRREFVKKINGETERLAPLFSQKLLRVEYQSSIFSKEDFLKQLLGHREKEIEYTYTTIGPHRDDLSFIFNNKEMAVFGSRGEWRLAMLIYLFALFEVLRNGQEEVSPICLFDDFYSELDKENIVLVERFLLDKRFLITAADLSESTKNLFKKANYLELLC